MAKYATKAAECTGSLDRRITPADRLADWPSASTRAATSPNASAYAHVIRSAEAAAADIFA